MIFGESVQLAFDSEGRILLPEAMLKGAKITEQATIVGKGEIFEIWQPAAFSAQMKRARDIMLEKRSHLRGGEGGKS
jgi:MraZ protein